MAIWKNVSGPDLIKNSGCRRGIVAKMHTAPSSYLRENLDILKEEMKCWRTSALVFATDICAHKSQIHKTWQIFHFRILENWLSFYANNSHARQFSRLVEQNDEWLSRKLFILDPNMQVSYFVHYFSFLENRACIARVP